MINKDKNANLQITIKKDDFKKLELIQKNLSESFNIDLTKSQTITYLINFFASKNGEKIQEQKPQKEQNAKPILNEIKSAEYYGEKLNQLRIKASLTNRQIAEQIGATRDQIKKWSANRTKPHGEQLQKLNELLKENGII